MIAIQLPLKVSVSSFGIIICFGSVYSMLILCVSEILRPIPVVNEIVEVVEDMDCEAVQAVQTNTPLTTNGYNRGYVLDNNPYAWD